MKNAWAAFISVREVQVRIKAGLSSRREYKWKAAELWSHDPKQHRVDGLILPAVSSFLYPADWIPVISYITVSVFLMYVFMS